MNPKASELRKSLIEDKKLSAGEADILVKAKVATGDVENDEAPETPEIDASDIDAFATKLSKAQPLAGAGTDSLAKAGSADDLIGLLETFAAAQDQTFERLDDNHTILGEGILAVGKVVQQMAKSFGAIHQTNVETKALLADVRERLGDPKAPRGIDNAADIDVVKRPGEEGGMAKSATKASVQRAAVDEQKRSDTPQARRRELAEAVKRMEHGEEPGAIARKFGITL